MRILVVYFSAGGRTRKAAATLAKMASADLFEIRPVKPYSRGDLNWMNPVSRCNREKIRNKDVPVADKVSDFDSYDVVLIGFPIWYGCAPNVVNTFCKEYDWSGKKVGIFATSGGSGMGKTAEKLSPYVKGAEIISEKLITGRSELESWLKSLQQEE